DQRIPLGPDPALGLWVRDPEQVDAEAAYTLLTGPPEDFPAGFRVTPGEVYGGVILWVALRDQRFSWLEMQGPGAAASPVPYLFALAGRYASAAGLFEPSGAAFLMRPPGEAPPAEPVAESPSFELFVRGLGADGGLARHLLAEVRAWDAAGRPGA